VKAIFDRQSAFARVVESGCGTIKEFNICRRNLSFIGSFGVARRNEGHEIILFQQCRRDLSGNPLRKISIFRFWAISVFVSFGYRGDPQCRKSRGGDLMYAKAKRTH
jgi:hypothetical protein